MSLFEVQQEADKKEPHYFHRQNYKHCFQMEGVTYVVVNFNKVAMPAAVKVTLLKQSPSPYICQNNFAYESNIIGVVGGCLKNGTYPPVSLPVY